MAKLESKFQKEFIDEVKRIFPGCVVLKNDSSYIQGFPDWTILYKDKWAVLEAKREKCSKHQPNQDYYVNKLNQMGYSDFVYPENKDAVIFKLKEFFN